MYVNTSSNHPPQIIKHLPASTAKRHSKNLSSIEIFNTVKVEYENALENSRYHSIKLNYTQTRENKPKHNRSRNIIWFNPPYSQNVITNVAKHFLNLLDHDFPKSNKLHKIFNRNTVKVSCSCNRKHLQHYQFTQQEINKKVMLQIQGHATEEPNQHAP